MYTYYIIGVCILSFGLIHFFVSIGIFFRMAGLLAGSSYASHALEKFFLLISSVFIAIFAPLLAFLTEAVFSVQNFILLIVLSQFLAFILLSFTLIFRGFLISWAVLVIESLKNNRHFYLGIFPLLIKINNYHFKFNNLKSTKIHFRFLMTGFLINIFSGSGFFIAFLMSNGFPEYRLTLSQSAIFIHGIGLVLQSLYADPALARLAEINNSNDWQNSFISYIWGKCLSFFFMAFLFLLIYLYVKFKFVL
jgi:hypothetical protein